MSSISHTEDKKKRIPAIVLLLFLIAAAVLAGGCQNAKEGSEETGEVTAGFFAMDTYMTLKAYDAGKEDLQELQDETERLEKLLSVTDPDSDIYRLDQEKEAEVSEETADILKKALEYCEKSRGSFDISVYPLVREWGFTTGDYHVPEPETIRELLSFVDYTGVEIRENSIALKDGMEIDLGGITKGYLGDQMVRILKDRGVGSAILDLGGNIVTLGTKPGNVLWKVGIRNPKGEEYLGYLEVSDCSVVTSGGYERYFEDEDGNLWWHILDPADGYPARNGLISVTVIGENGAYCDAMSTALFVMGKEKAMEFWRENQDFEAVFVTDQNEILLTDGIRDRFTFNEANAKDYTLGSAD